MDTVSNAFEPRTAPRAAPDAPSRRWEARLELRYECRGRRTVLAERRHEGPLVVQKALYPEGDAVCHGIVLHPPGGIAGGDVLAIGVRLDRDAHALLTTPGATKWYRSEGHAASQRVDLDVGPGAALEWLPQASIVFDRAIARMATRIRLARDACFVGWEITCLGRTASGERFRAGQCLSDLEIECAGRTIWVERARIDGGGRLLDSPVGLAGEPVSALMLAASERVDADLVNRCRRLAPATGRGGVTRLPRVLAARYLGPSVEAAHAYFAEVWRIVRPALLGREAQPPRIWRT